MTRRATHVVVTIATADLRRRPDHRSEMRSQLLLGEVARRLRRSPDRSWTEVENLADGYRGWVRDWALVAVGTTRARRWQARARWRVVAPSAWVTGRPGGGAPDGLGVGPLPFNARVIAGPRRRGSRAVEFPDGRRGWVPSPLLARIGSPAPPLLERVRSLLGCPYLWGGRSPWGFDCSGFVQQVLAEQGVRIPRDADQQWGGVRPIPGRQAARPGDLVFFAPRGGRVSHVGLWLGGGYFAHARGQVRLASLDGHNPLCDKVLLPQVRGFGRPLGRRPRGSRPG
jgi:hypothetical protein